MDIARETQLEGPATYHPTTSPVLTEPSQGGVADVTGNVGSAQDNDAVQGPVHGELAGDHEGGGGPSAVGVSVHGGGYAFTSEPSTASSLDYRQAREVQTHSLGSTLGDSLGDLRSPLLPGFQPGVLDANDNVTTLITDPISASALSSEWQE